MSQSLGNVRVRRTKKLLREALIALIEERGFEALTVGEIAERAMISRAAFYRHYQDKYDLIEQIFAEAIDDLFNTASDLGQNHPSVVWIAFFEHIAHYHRLYRVLLGKTARPHFIRKMRASLVSLIKERGHATHQADTHAAVQPMHTFSDDFVPDLVAAMFVEAITWWLEHHQPSTPTEIATRTSLLAAAIFEEASTWK